MVVESIAILIIIAAIFFVFLRSHKPKSALSTIPLMAVPAMHLLGIPLSKWLGPVLPIDTLDITIAMDIIGFLLFAVLAGVFLKHFHSKKTKAAYFVASGIFTLALTTILIMDSLNKLL